MTFDVPLASIRERLRQVGSQLEIERRERGTTVRAIAPLPRDAS
jgi:signal transduction histidine kinase